MCSPRRPPRPEAIESVMEKWPPVYGHLATDERVRQQGGVNCAISLPMDVHRGGPSAAGTLGGECRQAAKGHDIQHQQKWRPTNERRPPRGESDSVKPLSFFCLKANAEEWVLGLYGDHQLYRAISLAFTFCDLTLASRSCEEYIFASYLTSIRW